MWEVVVLHALTKCGKLLNEDQLPSGRRPDITFESLIVRFTADITTVSDEGLDAENPYSELSELLEKTQNKLGLPLGGLDVQVKSKRNRSARGVRTVLRLPPRKQLEVFVQERLLPQLRDQISAGKKVLRIAIDDEEVGLDITIDTAGSQYNSGGFATYNIPTIKDRNPLYNALRAKAAQLRGAAGVTGVIVGDGDCAALVDRQHNWEAVSAAAIAREFLRQYSSVDFVLMLTVRERRLHGWAADRRTFPILVVRSGCAVEPQIQAIFTAMLSELPKPVAMPVNGALRAREAQYPLGHHGGGKMSQRRIRISSRELTEVLAGLRTLGDGATQFGEAAQSDSPQSAFLRNLTEGRLPVAVTVIKTDENHSDDWIEFEFGDPDPAISPLR
ncbi:hypothetical protein [Ensifer sesbaniae]|uniref:hypothetical protein n=1 Tax=Ensifer sesbaniae TaxID=1214071 RepID=UPI001FE98B88|nr:hypothetical protein [Ensifer sesbaniae]